MAATLALSACAQDRSKSGGAADAGDGSDSQTDQNAAADAVSRFAINAPQGSSSQVSYEGRQVFVTVGPYYASAAGNRCRRVTMREPNGGSHVSAVCRRDGAWRTVLTY